MSNVTKPRKYYFVESSQIGQIPLVAGNVIALIDANGFYYDVEDGGAVVRRPIAGNRQFIYERPTNATPGELNTLYICDTGETLTGSEETLYELYVWDDVWYLIGNNTHDINVSSLVDTTVTYYLTGSTSNASTTGRLTKRSDVYVDSTGKINAPGGFGGGKADSAIRSDSTASADTATSATQDGLGNNIAETYIKSLLPNVNNSSVLITMGDNSTDTINTYVPPNVSTSGAGLAPIIPQDITKNILYRDGWKALDISGMTADSADKDSSGQQITSTYIKSLSFDPATRELEVTKGNDTVVSPAITIPDTTYNDYSGPGNGHGLVPASTSGNAQRYLRVDGSWQTVPDYTGATGGNAGTAGLVKAPQAADSGKFLKGDGTWSVLPVFAGSTSGVVPASASGDQNKVLKGDGSWYAIPNYTGATSSTDGVAGLVNPALSADVDKFYKGDGTWGVVPTMQGATTVTDGASGLVPTPTASDSAKYLCGDGSWQVPIIPVFTTTNNGLTPASGNANASNYLNAEGQWTIPTRNTTGALPIGNTEHEITDQFYGDGSTTAFTLQYTPSASTLSVTLDGTALVDNTDYTVSANIITLTNAPVINSETENFVLSADTNIYPLAVYASAITSVTVGGVSVASTNYLLSDNSLVIIDQSSYSTGAAIVVNYSHPQILNATYSVALSNVKMGIVAAPDSLDYTTTYTQPNAYILNGKLYSNNKEVVTVDDAFGVSTNGLVPGPTSADSTKYLAADGNWTSPLPTVVADTSFTPVSGLTVTSKKYGHSYYITVDGTATSSISSGSAIATTTETFNKVYAVGLVGSSTALFTLDGTSIICDTAIAANDTIAVSLNALA